MSARLFSADLDYNTVCKLGSQLANLHVLTLQMVHMSHDWPTRFTPTKGASDSDFELQDYASELQPHLYSSVRGIPPTGTRVQ